MSLEWKVSPIQQGDYRAVMLEIGDDGYVLPAMEVLTLASALTAVAERALADIAADVMAEVLGEPKLCRSIGHEGVSAVGAAQVDSDSERWSPYCEECLTSLVGIFPTKRFDVAR